MLTVVLEPDDAKGTALLECQRTDGPNQEWYYVSMVRRVRDYYNVANQL